MNSYLQLLVLLLSLLFGFIMGFIINFNMIKIFKYNKVINIVIYLLLAIVLSLAYIVLLYYICSGIIHIYFYIMVILGYYLYFKCKHLYKKRKSLDY